MIRKGLIRVGHPSIHHDQLLPKATLKSWLDEVEAACGAVICGDSPVRARAVKSITRHVSTDVPVGI